MDKFYRMYPLVTRREDDNDDTEEKDAEDFTVRARLSSGAVDKHRTRMDVKTTLKNFVVEAAGGVPLMDTHNRKLGVGTTSNADLIDDVVVADLNVVRGVGLGVGASYPDTDTLIRMIEKGVVREVSVGAYGGVHRCNVCGNDMWRSWECFHWPGMSYVVGEGDDKREVECIPTIEDAHLGEVSFVPIASNPDAKVLARAKEHAESGQLNSKQIVHINRLFDASIDLQRANDIEVNRIGGIDLKDENVVQETQLKRLTDENEKLRSENEALMEKFKTQHADLEKAQETLAAERQEIRSESLNLYRQWRGEHLTGDDLQAYEKRLDSFDLTGLKQELELLSSLVRTSPAPIKIESGQQTNQADKTGSASGSASDRACPNRGLTGPKALDSVYPPWMVQ